MALAPWTDPHATLNDVPSVSVKNPETLPAPSSSTETVKDSVVGRPGYGRTVPFPVTEVGTAGGPGTALIVRPPVINAYRPWAGGVVGQVGEPEGPGPSM